MYDLILHKHNEAFLKFECSPGIAMELSNYFEFFVPGFQFTPAFRNKLWDGKIRLADLRSFTIYHGLLPYIQKFCKERDYTIQVDSKILENENFSLQEAKEFIQSLDIPLTVKKYQLIPFVHAIRKKRMLLISPTASGKSLIQYLIVRYIQFLGYKKGLLIVPTTALVEQMYTDFESYGYESEKYCHRQYAGKDKITNKFLTITTWQSIYTNGPEYFHQFDFVLGDEAHLFKAKSFIHIMTNLENAEYRFGTTGTLDGTKTHKLVLEGLFGPSYQEVTTSDLMTSGDIATLHIKCLILKWPEDSCRIVSKLEYKDEKEYIVTNNTRNNFIKNLALSLEGNTLVLFDYVEKQGIPLHTKINEAAGDRKVFLVYGKVEAEEREIIRSIVENEKNAIIVASYKTFATGTNIKNLNNVIFGSPSKSRIRVLQSIGRSLRITKTKLEATLFDIADDFRISENSKMNKTLEHFVGRTELYSTEKFKYKIYNIGMKNVSS